MNSSQHAAFILLLAMCAALACSSKDKKSDELTSCPPAPLEDQFQGRPCHDLGCRYASPNGFDSKWSSICNDDTVGECPLGKFEVGADAIVCCAVRPKDVTWCGQPINEGAPCNQPDNSECVLPDQSATCACDKPGPVWRCLPLDGGVHYCDCSDNTVASCPDAGTDAGDAG